MKIIQLTRGQVALVDDVDYVELSKFKWCVNYMKNIFYAVRKIGINKKQYHELMHRRILGLVPGDKKHTDHINGNGLDNRRNNLRICTKSQNGQNRMIRQCNNTSGYKGVYWCRGKWQVRIVVNSKHKYIGRFASLIKAALAYNEAALKYYGEFARLNQID